MKPPLHQCTRCGQPEHEPSAACDGKSRHQRRLQTALAPKCPCGNTATSGDTRCGACRALLDEAAESRTRKDDFLTRCAGSRTLESLRGVVYDLIQEVLP